MEKYKLVVFDIAGTTVRDEDYVAKSFVNAFKKVNIDLSIAEINPLMGLKKTEAITIVLSDKKIDVSDALVDNIHDEFIDQMVSFYSTSSAVEPLPYVEEIFNFLHDRGIYVALNSGFPKIIVDVILKRMGWLDNQSIDYYLASDEVAKGRPYPFMINGLMEKSGISDPKQIIKVGDTMVDIQEGRMANCGLVIGVTTGAYSREELSIYSPDHIIDHLKELEQFFV